MYFGHQRTSFRRRIANYLDTTSLGIYLELIQAVLSLCSCALYVGESYYKDDIPKWMNVTDLILVIIFLGDFCLHVFIAEKKLSYVFSRDGMIDILTVVPVLAGMIATDYIAYRHVFFFLRPARVLRAVRILRFLPAATKSTAARRQLILLIFSACCLIFIFSGLFQYVENSSVLGDTIQRGEGQPYPFLPFHEAVYFIVILAYTVSFGDPIPTNWLGKAVTMLYITVTALVIPLQIRKLIKILAMQKDGGWVVKSRKNPHIIATGSINPTNIASFLNDFFDERNKHDKTKVVVLSGNIYSEEIDVIHLPIIEKKVSWLMGSVLVPVDLLRSQVRTAKGAFIFADHVSPDPNKEDKLNIMRALALRKHNPSMAVSLQLIDSSWKAHVNDDSIFAFALDEIKMSMMAWSTLYPGFSTLLSNMLMWRLQINPPVNPAPWLNEYVTGLNQTVFEAEVPHRYLNNTFSSAIMDIYNQYGITLVGIRKATTKKVSIAPLNVSVDDRLTAGDTFLLISDIMQLTEFCGTHNTFVNDLYFYQKKKKSFYERIPIISKIARRRDDIFDSFALDVQSDHRELQDEAIVTGENTGVFFHESYQDSLVGKKGPRKRRAVREIVHQDLMSPRTLRLASQPKDQFRSDPSKFLVDLDDNRSRARTIEYCTITKLEPHVRNHVVLCGCPRSRLGLFHFMQPYLYPARNPGDSNAPIMVLVLSPEPPKPEVWAEVSEMTNITYMKGSSLNVEDLRLAGIDRARAVVVLSNAGSGSTPQVKARSYAETADALYLQDADVILSTRAIQATLNSSNARVFVISETAHTKTFNLLAYNDTDNTDFFLGPEFAAGYFFDSGMTQRLIYQCHDKPFIRDMLSKLFTTKQKKRSTFISQIEVPDLEKMTYGSLFAHTVPRNMIPIGLYRPILDEEYVNNNNSELHHFVFLNPPANTIITSHDRVFVWCSLAR